MSAGAAVIAGTLRIAWFGVQDRIAILLIVTCAISALGMFGLWVRRVSTEADSGQRQWWKTASFIRALIWLGGFLVLSATLVIATLGFAWLGHSADFNRWIASTFALLLFISGIIPVLLTEHQRRTGKELLYGGHDLLGVDAWCEEKFGLWWLARVVTFALLAALIVCFGRPAPVMYILAIVCAWTGRNIEHACGLASRWKDNLRRQYSRLRELQATAHFRELRYRNHGLELLLVVTMFLGFFLPLLLGTSFSLYANNDWKVFWLGALGFGLMFTLPTGVSYVYILIKGNARFFEFVQYEELKNPGLFLGWKWCAAAFAIITIVATAMIARTARF